MTLPAPPGLPVLQTERLVLRPVTPADLPLLIELNADADVMRFVSGRPATAAETEVEWERRLVRQSCAERGLGYWLGFERGSFAGWWSASWYADHPERSGLGYRLPGSAWGRGLATEGARAMVQQALADPVVERVVASTSELNVGSRRVLEKLGMTATDSWSSGRFSLVAGEDALELGYALTRSRWAAGSGAR